MSQSGRVLGGVRDRILAPLRSGSGRPSTPPLTAAVIVLVVATFAVVLGPALLGRGVLLDVDSLSGRLPFRAIAGTDFAHTITCRSDTYDYYLPGVAEIRRGLGQGQLRTWAPYEVGGSPLASLPNHGLFSPLSWPYLVMPLWLAPAYVVLTQLVVAIGGMVLFLRRRGVSLAGAWLAGFAFTTSGFMLAWTNWPHTRVAALLPLLMYAVERAVHDSRVRDVVLVAAVLASMLLGGFPAVTLFGLTLAAAYAVLRLVQLHRGDHRRLLRAALAPIAGVLLGVGLSAVQILPFAANLSSVLSDRTGKGGEHLPLGAALSLLAPATNGECVGGERYGPNNPIEAMGYVGCAVAVLVLVAVATRRPGAGVPRTFLGVALVVVGLVVWTGGPLLAVLDLLPLYGSNSTTRAQSVVGLLAAALAAVGLDRLVRLGPGDPTARPPGGRPAWRHLAVAAGAGLVLVAVVLAQLRTARSDGYLGHLGHAVLVPAVLLVVAVTVVVLARWSRGRRWSRWSGLAPVVLVLLVVGQGGALAHTMWPRSSRAYFYPETPTHRFLRAHLGGERYAAGDGTMDAAVTDWYELRTPVGHEFTTARWKDLIAAVDPLAQRTSTYSAFSSTLPFATVETSALLDRLAVRYWVLSPQHPVGRVDLPSAGGVTTLAPGGTAQCRVPGGPLRGVVLDVRRPVPSVPGDVTTLRVSVTAGGQTRTGATLVGARAEGPLSVSVAAEDLPGGPATVRVSLDRTTRSLALTGDGSRLRCGSVRPVGGAADPVRLVFSDAGSAIYQRLDALPRIRWAAHSTVVSPDQQVAWLTGHRAPHTVVLDDDSTPPADGSARVRVVEDGREQIAADVRARGRGYLVVADSIARPGWSATVDGRPARLVAADHALAAVPVPAGRHRVVLRYVAPGLHAGVVVSGVSVVVSIGLLALPSVRRRTRRAGPGLPGGDPDDG